MSILDKLKARVQLARQIETAQHKVKKKNHDRNWMKETAEALGVDLDSDYLTYETCIYVPCERSFTYCLTIVMRRKTPTPTG